MWSCPQCQRSFTRENQRHACGTGDLASVLRNRPAALVKLYESIETHAKSLGPIEVVARERYVLLRTQRIFADLVMMSDAVRIAIHLHRQADDPIFFKVVADHRHITHVAKLRTPKDWATAKPYLTEAHQSSLTPR